jgi:hypothetical protein
MKIIFSIIITVLTLFIFNFQSTKLQNLQFISDLDGKKILESIDRTIKEDEVVIGDLNKSFLGIGKHRKKITLDKINAENADLNNLWNSTVMIFGAASDGVGIGTGFAIKKIELGQIYFITNFHVIEKFCETPSDVFIDNDFENNNKFNCQSLFVLHDVKINTITNTAEVEGLHPFKTEVNSLQFFDKQKDIAVFKVDVPNTFEFHITKIENSFNLKELFILQVKAEKNDSQILADVVNGVKVFPLTAFNIYLPSYTVPSNSNDQSLAWIKKDWHKGKILNSETYENEKKLGFITALRHDIDILPGSSGAPMALSDGRVISINTSKEVKQFYVKKGILWWRKNVLETHQSFFSMPITFINDFFVKLN